MRLWFHTCSNLCIYHADTRAWSYCDKYIKLSTASIVWPFNLLLLRKARSQDSELEFWPKIHVNRIWKPPPPYWQDPCGSRGRCRIGPPRFLAVCRTRRLNLLLYFRLFVFFVLYLVVYFPMCSSCLLYTSPSPRDGLLSRMPSSA